MCQILLSARLAMWEDRFVMILIMWVKGEMNTTISHFVFLQPSIRGNGRSESLGVQLHTQFCHPWHSVLAFCSLICQRISNVANLFQMKINSKLYKTYLIKDLLGFFELLATFDPSNSWSCLLLSIFFVFYLQLYVFFQTEKSKLKGWVTYKNYQPDMT